MTRFPVPTTALLVAAALIICAPASAATGDGGFGDPVGLAAVPTTATLLAALPAGSAAPTILYSAGTSLVARDVGTGASGPRTVGALGTPGAPLATASRAGVRLVAWFNRATSAVQAAVAPPGAAFGPAQTLASATGVAGVRAAVAGDGTLLVAYQVQGGSAAVAVARGGGAFGPALALPTTVGASSLRLAAGANGTAVALWQTPPAGVIAAALSPGAAAFGPAEPVPVTADALPALAVLPSGEAVLSANGRTVVRRAPDGAYAPAETLAGAQGGPTDVAVADDGTVAVVGSSGLGGVRAWVAPPGGAFGAPLALGAERDGLLPTAFVWSGGTVAVLDQGATGDASLAETKFFATPRGGVSGTTLFGPTTPVVGTPGTAPGSFDAYAAAGGELYRLARPQAPAHGRPRVTFAPFADLRLNRKTGTTSIELTTNKFGTASVSATARSGRRRVAAHADFLAAPGGHRVTLPAFLPARVHVTLPASARPCRGVWDLSVAVTFRDRSGDAVRRMLRFPARCS
jgi:hypothetical protein